MTTLHDMAFIKSESEKIALGTLIDKPELIKDCLLVKESFFSTKHQALFKTLKELDDTGKPIEIVSIFEHLGLHNADQVGGISYVMELQGLGFTTVSFSYHQDLIIEYSKKRKLIALLQKSIREVENLNANSVMRKVIDDVLLLEDQDIDEDDGHISKVLTETYEYMETDHGSVTGAKTNLRELDNMTQGLHRQDLVLIGGRPSMGKTAFAVQVCMNHAENKPKERPNGGPVAIFSIEMRNRALALRMISNLGNIDGGKMRNPHHHFEPQDWDRSTSVLGQLGNLPIHMFDDASMDIAYIRRKLRLMKKLYPGQHIVAMIDYLQLIRGNPEHRGNRTQEISEISRELKKLAREMDLTLIALSQLSRGVESRQDKRPMSSDLRESGQLEQDADLIMFLYRDDYYNHDSEIQGLVEVIVQKQRNGPVGTVTLAYMKEYSKFVNIAKG